MAVSLIPELEDVVRHGTRAKRIDALQRITALFLDGAKSYSDAHVDLFDDVFGLLIEEIETKARAELSRHLAPVGNAPVKVLRTLANDDDIAVAGPVLKYAPRLAETDLVGVAKTKRQAHLQAISVRPALGEAVAEKVGLRPDIPEPMFRELLTKATAVVRSRLVAAATADGKAEIHRVLAKVSKEVGARAGPRDYSATQRVVLSLDRAGRLNETALAAFCSENKFEETVVALATLAKVPINVADRLLGGDRPDPVLILCRAIGLNWSAVKAIVMLRPDAKNASNQGLESAFANYERLSNSTARRVVRFWQVRQAG